MTVTVRKSILAIMIAIKTTTTRHMTMTGQPAGKGMSAH
ncbi:hypothetical protein X971_2035 [Agrobacterium tumefaciens LBA4213 (Ach5)]|nr:hypothetical protein X971_2035 [Agrobacterium tumefaciens LBA4213 (Ach5)]